MILLFVVVIGVFAAFVAVNMAATGRSVGEAAKTTWDWNAGYAKRNFGVCKKIAGAAIKAAKK